MFLLQELDNSDKDCLASGRHFYWFQAS